MPLASAIAHEAIEEPVLIASSRIDKKVQADTCLARLLYKYLDCIISVAHRNVLVIFKWFCNTAKSNMEGKAAVVGSKLDKYLV